MNTYSRRFLMGMTLSATGAYLGRSQSAKDGKPRLGVTISADKHTPEEAIAKVHSFNLPTCQVHLGAVPDMHMAVPLKEALAKYGVEATAVMTLGPGPFVWDFYRGPETIGLVPPPTRAARIDALKRASDVAKACGIGAVHTH